MNDYDYENEYDMTIEEKPQSTWVPMLSLLSTWFIRVGLSIGVILFLYFLFTFQVSLAFLFIIGMVISYFFGYFFMFFLDKVISNDE